MIYHEKPAVDNGAAKLPAVYPRTRPGISGDANGYPVRGRPSVGTGSPPLLEKVRSFKEAERIRASGLYPYFRTISSAQDTEVLIEGEKVLMLGSNSYLGLTNHPKIKEAARAAVEKY